MTARSKYVQTLRDLSDAVLACHVYRHAWELLNVSRNSPVGLEVWTVHLHCGRCGTDRDDQVEPGTFALYARRYSNYPDGYRLAEPVSQDDKRAEIVMRALEKGQIA